MASTAMHRRSRNIKKGFMTATAWQDSYTEDANMIKLLPEIVKAGASWDFESR